MNPLLLEIGTEEIPAGYIQPALGALATNLSSKLTHSRITHGAVHTCGTPRRLVVRLDDVADRQQSITEEVLGPPERIAFDENGQPTVPALKFSEKVGVPIKKLKITETEKGRYLSATISDKGLATKTVLQKMLPEIILATPFPKTMRWSELSISFARPIQSILALFGKSIVSFTLEDKIKSGRYAWGHMFMQHRKVKVDDVTEYADKMRQAHVIVDVAERKEMVRKEIEVAAKALGGKILPDEELLDIVTNLVEIPFATGGKFDDVFLELPREILITSMREHQKYFAVVDDNDQLMPCFVAVNNTRTKDLDLVATGHERVLRARLSDAQFFYRADLENKMDDWREQLKGVLFQAKLGSMHAKVKRVEALGAHLTQLEDAQVQSDLKRAAQLCKTDLVCQVVGEFAKLQGIMGRVYAGVANEPGDVAVAIEEHYRPIYSGGSLPQTRTGALLAIADKLDTICGCFSVGLIPTGASDPYALRRQGIGIVQILLKHQLDLSLKETIRAGLSSFETGTGDDISEKIYDFILKRVSGLLAEDGYEKDVIAAVTSVSIDDIPDVWKRTAALQALKGAADFEPLAAGFKRVVNILRKTELENDVLPNPTLFIESSEKGLYEAYNDTKKTVDKQFADGHLEETLRTIANLREPVDRFFEDVMVMAEDKTIRTNRLALLNVIAGLFNRMADFSKIAV